MPRRAVALLFAGLLAVVSSGCGGGTPDPPDDRVAPGRNLRVYASLPLHGDSAPPARASAAGMRAALEDAGGRVGRYRVELVVLDSSAPGRSPGWNPERVAANADAAADDAKAIAYIGELGHGGSSVSLPITNAAEMLQVSPTDGLTALVGGSARPASARERFYPSGLRTFQRLVAEDRVQAQALIDYAAAAGARRVATVSDGSPYARALAAEVIDLARCEDLKPLEPRTAPAPGDREASRDLARALRRDGAGVVIYLGADSLSATLAAAVGQLMPGVPLLAAGSTARSPAPGIDDVVTTLPTAPVAESPDRVDFTYGYDAMRLILTVIERSGRDGASRPAVARYGVEERSYRGRGGRYDLNGRGEVTNRSVTLARIEDGLLGHLRPARTTPCR